MFNHFLIQGRVVKELEPTDSKNGLKFVKFPIACSRVNARKNENPITDFFDITAFGKSAEFAINHFHKGTHLLIEGHLQNYSFEKEGKKYKGFSMIADKFEFLSPKKVDNDIKSTYEDDDEEDEPTPF